MKDFTGLADVYLEGSRNAWHKVDRHQALESGKVRVGAVAQEVAASACL